jgi:hypothetical protein
MTLAADLPRMEANLPPKSDWKGRGRPSGTRNRAGHHAGRPKGSKTKPKEPLPPSIWEAGRAEISVLDRHFDEAMEKNSSHCAIAFAIRDAVPYARHIAVDLQTIRWTDPRPGRNIRYVFLTPAVAQHNVIIPFDQGDREGCKPVTFRMKPAFVTKAGKKRRHTPDPEQLTDVGLRVSPHQPHIPAPEVPESRSEEGPPAPEGVEQPDIRIASGSAAPDAEKDLAEVMREDVPVIAKRDAALGKAIKPVPAPKRKPRVARAKVSAATRGVVPVTLGGKLPPVSVLARREFGLRALRR